MKRLFVILPGGVIRSVAVDEVSEDGHALQGFLGGELVARFAAGAVCGWYVSEKGEL